MYYLGATNAPLAKDSRGASKVRGCYFTLLLKRKKRKEKEISIVDLFTEHGRALGLEQVHVVLLRERRGVAGRRVRQPRQQVVAHVQAPQLGVEVNGDRQLGDPAQRKPHACTAAAHQGRTHQSLHSLYKKNKK